MEKENCYFRRGCGGGQTPQGGGKENVQPRGRDGTWVRRERLSNVHVTGDVQPGKEKLHQGEVRLKSLKR